MYTESRFPVLEHQFEWYNHSLIVDENVGNDGAFIATIDMETGEIRVGPLFEFMAYKVQVFLIHQLISLLNERTKKKIISSAKGTVSKETVQLSMIERFPNIGSDYFFRAEHIFSVKSYRKYAICFL